MLRGRPSRGIEHRMWTVAVLAGLIGALLATGTTLATGSMRTRKVPVPALEQDLMTPVVTLAAASASSVAATLAEVRPSCVEITAKGPHGMQQAAGVVFRSDGMVLTAAHAVSGAQSLTAVVGGTRTVSARVIASDPASDLAVIKLAGTGGYTPAPLGTALNLRIGDPVVGLEPTNSPAAHGLVAGLGKTFTGGGTTLDGLMQITTDHEPATVGGPVLDRQGAVIGLASGIGEGSVEFATPVDWARQVAGQLMTTGRVVPVWLGVLGHDLPASSAAALQVTGGAVIDRIYASSPASLAGLRAGDEVLGIDGKAVLSMANLIMAVRARPDGTVVELDVRRGTTSWTMDAVLSARPASVS